MRCLCVPMPNACDTARVFGRQRLRVVARQTELPLEQMRQALRDSAHQSARITISSTPGER
jgi:hypothetical protein